MSGEAASGARPAAAAVRPSAPGACCAPRPASTSSFAVISHLHAVAEAVEDVIWVERHPEGSSASWLSLAARDALVRQDVAGGLLSLVS